jgi:transposase
MRYLLSLQEKKFDHPAHQSALQEMFDAIRVATERVEGLDRAIAEFVPTWSLAPLVAALQASRGVDLVVAATFESEIGDLRRFENRRQLMGYLGLVPAERSTGDTIRRGGITKTGNGRVGHILVEEAWTYRHPAAGWNEEALQIGAGTAQDPRDGMESAVTLDCPISGVEPARQDDDSRLHCDCS